ncbi:HlyD family efflux transporter periplasmic adaptor subunit [Chromobacterium phragmitis]|uniref:efflux RND transporter periplasmic adaptor subunit n=1 Tax=Chromobacterium amazonense TaxID=1382803 RepID=UPI0021B757DC|nr:HlyD family efflux transporter periplasmic adaptor subunit [Chromobacterium amazonense]MBM2882941.1 HlyD family efflux transporter periplasmic adaptor subunit [Chromobacterium amazonense]
MSEAHAKAPVSGAAMDEVVARKRWSRGRLAGLAALLLALVGAAAWWAWQPSGLRVAASELQIATVVQGRFSDEVILRATVQPAQSVLLDLVEGGRVDEVLVHDGDKVKAGQVLLRLSNPQRQLELLARKSDLAQQYANLSSTREQLEATRSDYRRRLSDLGLKLKQQERQYRRDAALAAQGFISTAALEDSRDRLQQYREDYRDEQQSQARELSIKAHALRQMQQVQDELSRGTKMASDSLAALSLRAPMDGQLTNFTAQVGSSLKPGDRVGRVDGQGRYKLTAQVDEFYLARVKRGQLAAIELDGGATATARVGNINPQVQDGHFQLELLFDAQPAGALNAGQGLDGRLTLGQAASGLVLPNGAFVNDTGGTWAMVLNADGSRAERRAIRLGRRSQTQLEVVDGLKAGERVIVSSYAAFGKYAQLTLQ